MTKVRASFPLLAQVLGWLLLHLLILALAFVAFVGWQLRLGLDSLLSGSAGDRLRTFGESAREEIINLPRPKWNPAITALAERKHVKAAILDSNDPASLPFEVPPNIYQRSLSSLPPPHPPARRGPPRDDWAGPPDDAMPPFGPRGSPPPDVFPEDRPPFGEGPPPIKGDVGPDAGVNNPAAKLPNSSPVFLQRGDHGDGYWAGVQLSLPGPLGRSYRPHLLLIRAENLDGSGMFFDFKPWLWGGLAVLALSLAFWTPFVWGITRYLHRLTSATDGIAAGDFKIFLPPRGNDELGNLGTAIESMAVRLDQLISGQKRFLGDAAHELCAPLARLRTGLGILEMKLNETHRAHLVSVESDAQELATLVEEILAFSRVGGRTPHCQLTLIDPLVREVVAREGGSRTPEIAIHPELTAFADASLLSRAIGNLIRNARIHAGPDAKVSVIAEEIGEFVSICVADDGPGVPVDELASLFEPFYRPDRSRSRDTGGNGLGLAIVRSALEACGGEAFASIPADGGFAVTLRLRKLPAELA